MNSVKVQFASVANTMAKALAQVLQNGSTAKPKSVTMGTNNSRIRVVLQILWKDAFCSLQPNKIFSNLLNENKKWNLQPWAKEIL